MKTCFKCNETQPLDEFYAHPRMADGRLGKCKSCARRDTAEREARLALDPMWLIGERARHREKSRKARDEGRAKPAPRSRKMESMRAYFERYPDKHKAHGIVRRAIRKGALKPQPCEKCGAKAQAHHDDYSKPLDVRWLCVKHHAEHHVRERENQLLQKP